MPPTLQEVRRRLAEPRVDYDSAAALGPQVVPHLATLVDAGDTTLAAKALYLAGVIGGPESRRLLTAASAHHDPIVRIAASAAIRTMKTADGAD